MQKIGFLSEEFGFWFFVLANHALPINHLRKLVTRGLCPDN